MEIVGSQRELPLGGGKELRIWDLSSVPCHSSPLACFRTLSKGLSASEPQAHPPCSEDIRLAGLCTSHLENSHWQYEPMLQGVYPVFQSSVGTTWTPCSCPGLFFLRLWLPVSAHQTFQWATS